MFNKIINNKKTREEDERKLLNSLTEKELLIEVIIELKKLNDKCDDIANKIVIWSN